ncbi:Endonuclease/exonuclease/phosphatase, partial [Panaeolus papilionaceus]
QQNLNKLLSAQLQMLHTVDPGKYDIILIQEPHIDHLGNTRANGRWQVVYPNGHWDKPHSTQAVTLINTSISTNAWTPEFVDSQDMVMIKIKVQQKTVGIYNVYNDCNHDDSMRAVRESMREEEWGGGIGETEMMWVGDFNRHHPMWDEERNNHLFTRTNLRAA